MKVKLSPYLVVALAFVAAGAILLIGQIKNGRVSLPIITIGLSSQKLAEKTIDYINKNLVQPGVTATLVKVSDMGNVYRLDMKITGRDAESYVTKDGRFFFPEGFDLNDESDPRLRQNASSNTEGGTDGSSGGGGCGI